VNHNLRKLTAGQHWVRWTDNVRPAKQLGKVLSLLRAYQIMRLR
jgi:hypothetical protein